MTFRRGHSYSVVSNMRIWASAVLLVAAAWSKDRGVLYIIASASSSTASCRPTMDSPSILSMSVDVRGLGPNGDDVSASPMSRNSRFGPTKRYRVVQVHIAHRHGDRTPITPMKDTSYWSSTVLEREVLTTIGKGTSILRRRRDNSPIHTAGGQGPFGQLTQMGLVQMIELGRRLREDLICKDHDDATDKDTHDGYQQDKTTGHWFRSHLWDLSSSPSPIQDTKVLSTDFPRTIQSVQGLLMGLFPEGIRAEEEISIDCRHTSWMIPDPEPRRTFEQVEREMQLSSRPYIQQRERELLPLAIRCTNALHDMLGEGAREINFELGEDVRNVPGASDSVDERPLPWAQLAEITKCLKVRNLLPSLITSTDQMTITEHTAWRWFETFRDPRLIHLATQPFASEILHSMRHVSREPSLVIYSGHDSTLISLLCIFRLEQPSVWPDYGSYLKIELLEVTDDNVDENGATTHQHHEPDYVVRFFFNGKLLRSNWDGEPRDMIPLNVLAHKIKMGGAVKAN